MYLTKDEERMLSGEEGEGVRKCMEIVAALGEIYGAEKMVPIRSAQVSGVTYKNLGEAGIEFIEELIKNGAKARILGTLNPCEMDLEDWEDIGIDAETAGKQKRIVDIFSRLGIKPVCTCTPYFTINLPKFGEHIAWGESSAVSFANSVLGARTNREGGPSALAAAVVGRTALYGYHLDENRKPTHTVNVNVAIRESSDFGALGYHVGKTVQNGVPYFKGVKAASQDQLKSLGAAMGAWGAVALYHVEGVTPEAKRGITAAGEQLAFGEAELKTAYKELDSASDDPDLVYLGCPHCSIDEVREIAGLVNGKKLKVPLWVIAARPINQQAEKLGYKKTVEAAGGKLLSDICLVVGNIDKLGYKTLAINSAKGAFYLASYAGRGVHFGTTRQCVDAAVNGKWK